MSKQISRSILNELINESQRIIRDLLEGRISHKEANKQNREIKKRIREIESNLLSGARIQP